jgi:chromosome segregation protein
MRFKTLEIQGFKSFPDKTVLTFDNRTTAVVGSNGSGKSNISDALRWVMGEQGAKTLRGDKMEDVIFHGTQERKQMGFAKVSLTIDNADGRLPVPAEPPPTDESGAQLDIPPSTDVVITRKLYRTGDSEYLINGRKSRLKDVHTLFMGTGLGRDGYSIIGQGRIDEIVNSKAASRREIFEEAAGVSKFLFQKAGAQRELDRTEDNLLRLLDIEKELQERLPKLERQAEKANKAFALKEEERALGVAVSVRELEHITKDTEAVNDTILRNQGECEQFEREISELEAEAEKILESKQSLNAQRDRLQRQNESARDNIEQISGQIADTQSEISRNEGRVSGLREQIELSEKSGEELTGQIADLSGQIEVIRGEIEQSEKLRVGENESLTVLDAQNTSLDGENAELDSEIRELYTAKAAAEIYIRGANTSVEEAQSRLTHARSLIAGQADEHRRLTESKAELKAELDELIETRDETENKLAGYSRLYESKAAKAEEAREQSDALKREEHRCKTRLDVLTDVENSMAGFYPAVKAVLQAAKSGRFSRSEVVGTVADVIKVENKFGTAVETALGSALQHIIVANESIAKRGIAFLKEKGAGRATFLPLTSVRGESLDLMRYRGLDTEDGYVGLGHEIVGFAPEYAGIIRSLLGRTVFAEDIDAATVIAKKHGYKFKIVTLDGQVINAGGSFTGGSVKKTEGIISRKQELDDLRKLAEKLAGETEPAKARCDLLAAECAKMKLECEGMRETLAKFSGEEMRLTAESDGVSALLRSFNERLEQSEEVIENCNDKIAAEQAAIAQHTADLERITSDLQIKEAAAAEKSGQLEEIVTRRRELSERITDLNMQKLTKSRDIEGLTAQITYLEKTRAQSGESREEQHREIAALEEANIALAEGIAEKRAEIAKIESELGGSKLQIAELAASGEGLEQRAVKINGEIREKVGDKEKFASALAVAYERKSGLERKSEDIKASLFDDYELTPSEAIEFAARVAGGTDGFASCGGLEVSSESATASRDIIKQAKAALAEIRKQLAALGDVNYAAVTEFAEETARFKDLSEQLADVRKAKRELEKLIDELTNDIRTRFLASFNEISAHFSRIFVEMFGGGAARLELVNPANCEETDDVLNAGIEIFAAPPGKVSKSLTMLSGGERALIAITLYFAILKHRPAPFCMLDEVDAALDDVKAAKYINYLKRYADSTQLMMITHRRATIEGCDVLYGVFMQEKGVSRLYKHAAGETDAPP